MAVVTVAGGRLADQVQEDDRDCARVLASIYQRPKGGDESVRNAERRERFECRHGRQRALVESRNEFGGWLIVPGETGGTMSNTGSMSAACSARRLSRLVPGDSREGPGGCSLKYRAVGGGTSP